MSPEDLRPGLIVWAIWSMIQGGRTRIRYPRPIPVEILDVDMTGRRINVRWNANPPRWLDINAATGWRKRKPRRKYFGARTY